MGDLRERLLPGTTTTYFEKGQKGFAKVDMLIKATGGLNLSQVCSVTGLEGSTIQNWVKRGWVANPRGKKYDEVHIARILIINALKECIKLEHIALLMRYVNGLTEDRSDDIIRESELFNYLCDALEMLGQEDDLSRSGVAAIVQVVIREYTGPTPDARERIRKALTIMIFACVCTDVKRRTEAMMGHVLKEMQNPGMAADNDDFNDSSKFERGIQEDSRLKRTFAGSAEFERAKQEILNREKAEPAGSKTSGNVPAENAPAGNVPAGNVPAAGKLTGAEGAAGADANTVSRVASQAESSALPGAHAVIAGAEKAGQKSTDAVNAGQGSANTGYAGAGQVNTAGQRSANAASAGQGHAIDERSPGSAGAALKNAGQQKVKQETGDTDQMGETGARVKENAVQKRTRNTVIISGTDSDEASGADRAANEQASVRRTVSQALREWDKKADEDPQDEAKASSAPEASAADRIVELAATGGIGSTAAADRSAEADERKTAGGAGGNASADTGKPEESSEKPAVKPVYFRRG